MKSITLKEFVEKYKDEISISDDAFMNKLQELNSQWIDVIWAKELIAQNNQLIEEEKKAADNLSFQQEYEKVERDWLVDTLTWLAPLAAIVGVPLWVSKILWNIYNDKKWVNIVKFIDKNLLNPSNTLKPATTDNATLDTIEYLSKLDDKRIKEIKSNPFGAVRSLYNHMDYDLKQTWEQISGLIKKNASKTVSYEILDPLKKEIARLWRVGWAKVQQLQKTVDEITWLLDDAGGSIRVDDAQILKETAYEWYDYARQNKLNLTAKQHYQWYANKLLWQWTRKSIENVVWEWIDVLNKSYGRLKNISTSVWWEVTKIKKMPRYTTIDKIRNEFWDKINMVPWVSALWNVRSDTPAAVFNEKKIPQIIAKIKKWKEPIIKTLEKAKKVADVVEESPATAKKLPYVWKLLSAFWLAAWLLSVASMSDAWYDIDPKEWFKSKFLPKYPGWEITPIDEDAVNRSIDKFLKQDSPWYIESPIMSKRWAEILELATDFSPAGLAKIPLEIVKSETQQKSFEKILSKERAKDVSKDVQEKATMTAAIPKLTWAGSVAKIEPKPIVKPRLTPAQIKELEKAKNKIWWPKFWIQAPF
jgi:hypothetical protein